MDRIPAQNRSHDAGRGRLAAARAAERVHLRPYDAGGIGSIRSRRAGTQSGAHQDRTLRAHGWIRVKREGAAEKLDTGRKAWTAIKQQRAQRKPAANMLKRRQGSTGT